MWNPNITPKYIEAWYIFSKCPLKLQWWYEILNSIYWASKLEITVILFFLKSSLITLKKFQDLKLSFEDKSKCSGIIFVHLQEKWDKNKTFSKKRNLKCKPLEQPMNMLKPCSFLFHMYIEILWKTLNISFIVWIPLNYSREGREFWKIIAGAREGHKFVCKNGWGVCN